MRISVRTLIFGAVFVAILLLGLLAQSVSASPLELGNTVPDADTFRYGVYLPQAILEQPPVDEPPISPPSNDNSESGDEKGEPGDNVDEAPFHCPETSAAHYSSLPVSGPPADRPPPIHADLNLSVRGYVTATMPLELVNINGPTDSNAPQLSEVVGEGAPRISGAYHVNQWDWACTGDIGQPWEGHGCRGVPITDPPVTLIGLDAIEGTPIRTPGRGPEIHAGDFKALVLYAEPRRITLVYTREDTAAHGYVVHLEDICVDPALLALYQKLDAGGRSWLPALRSSEQIGTASSLSAKIAIRDSGSFMDPRSRKDWWHGY